MVSRLIAGYSIRLEIVALGRDWKYLLWSQERKLLNQKESQQLQIESICLHAPIRMLSLERKLIILAKEAFFTKKIRGKIMICGVQLPC